MKIAQRMWSVWNRYDHYMRIEAFSNTSEKFERCRKVCRQVHRYWEQLK
jgi:hypothetical protein